MSTTQLLLSTSAAGDPTRGLPQPGELATAGALAAAGPALRLRPLTEAELAPAVALLEAALSWDRIAVVAAEKLFGGNGRRSGQALGAFTAAGELVGVLVQAGRFVKLLAVLPQAQRRGIGTALLAAARGAARAAGCRRLWLITTNDNTPAIRFYERRGFHVVAVHVGAVIAAREVKPEIPLLGVGGIPIEDEVEMESRLDVSGPGVVGGAGGGGGIFY